MIYPEAKLEDIEWRYEVLGLMRTALWRYQDTHDEKWLKLAQEAGDLSVHLKNLISTLDYTDREAVRNRKVVL